MGNAEYMGMKAMKAMKAAAPMKAKAMKAAGGKLTKSALCAALAEQVGVKSKVANALLGQIVEIGTAEVKKNGIFPLPGLARIKTRVKPATKACKKEIFGKMCEVKAKPAKTVVKAFAVSALKKQF